MNQIRHDHLGFYQCTEAEAAHEDAGNPSVGFDGREHYATLEMAHEAFGIPRKSTGMRPSNFSRRTSVPLILRRQKFSFARKTTAHGSLAPALSARLTCRGLRNETATLALPGMLRADRLVLAPAAAPLDTAQVLLWHGRALLAGRTTDRNYTACHRDRRSRWHCVCTSLNTDFLRGTQ